MKRKIPLPPINQNDANFMAGIEVGVRCAEKGMNLQAALAFGRETLRLYPTREYKENPSVDKKD